jgi:polyphosphate kinase
MCVIERIERGKVKRYGFISTGNFNEATAKVYTDVTLFTSHRILKDINKILIFFNIIIEHIVINTLLYHHIIPNSIL